MKLSYLIIYSLLTIALLVGGAQATTNTTPYDSSLVLLMHMNASPFTDENGATVTNTGTVTCDTVIKKLGAGSALFSGSNKLSVPSSADFDMTSSDATISFWINVSSLADNRIIFGGGASDNTGMYIQSDGSIAIGRPAVNQIASSAGVISANTWHHVVITRVQSTSTTTIYVDGVSVASGTTSVWIAYTSTFNIGSWAYAAQYLIGNVDEFAMWKGAAIPIADLHPQPYEIKTDPAIIPVASFSSRNISVATNSTSRGWEGFVPFTMVFNSTSSGAPTSFVFNATNTTGNNVPFGMNATEATLPNISYTFPVAGNYSIKLNVTGTYGANISKQSTWINVSQPFPVVAFTTNVTSGVNPLALYLNDTSTNSPTLWNTSWGDDSWTNQTSFPATNITHLYSTAGSYWINEYVTNPSGPANGTPLLITVYGFANSQFMASNTAGPAPFTTYLYDTSTNLTPGAVTYYWMLGDGNTSTAQNLFYTWNITGTYSVNHSMNNGLSLSWNNKSDYIVVGASSTTPVAAFYGGPQLGAPPMQVFLTDVSTNTPTSWNWSFGDGTYSTTKNPTKWYNSSGFFTVNLTVTNGVGSNKTVQTNFVMVY